MAKAAQQDPFGEFLDQSFEDVYEEPADDFEQPPLSQEVENESSGSRRNPKPPPAARTAKHAAASAKLKLVKTQADQVWKEHLNSSMRVAQVLGRAPRLVDSELVDGEPINQSINQ